MAKISGTLIDGAGQIINNCAIELYAKKTTSNVLTQTQAFRVTENGKYEINVLPCNYEVSLIINGFPKKKLGVIQVFSDSADGTLNDFLLNPAESEITPEILQQVIDARNGATESAKIAKENADTSTTNATNAGKSATQASSSANSASNSESNASKSAVAAKSSETNAKNSATQAAASATSADNSQTASAASEVNAKTSETNAKTSANTAATKAGEATASATNATNSANGAKLSETAAATSAKNAKTSETNSAASEKSAKDSAAQAVSSSSSAETSASSAGSSATSASVSALSASKSKDAASISESNSKTSEKNAAQSALEAKNSASSIDTSSFVKKSGDWMSNQLGIESDTAGVAYKNKAGQQWLSRIFTNGDLAFMQYDPVTAEWAYKFRYVGSIKKWCFENVDDVTISGYSIITTGNISNYLPVYVGEFRLFPFRTSELPKGWYCRNGDKFLLTSTQGQALNSLSANYKADHGITIKTISDKQYINVPTAFTADGRGYFERAVNGVSRQVGNAQDDTIRNITGKFTAYNYNANDSSSDGAIVRISSNRTVVNTASSERNTTYDVISLDASRVVPTSSENRPINMGLTPAIYLGV